MRLNKYLLRGATAGALGGLLFGFDTAVISGTTHQLTQVFDLNAYWLGFTVFIALAGTVVGAFTTGELGQRMGGRNALRVMAVLYLVSAIGCAFAWSWHALLVFRFIGGLGIGGSSVLGPVYIAEIAPAKWRGRLVGLFQVNIVVGILAAYLSNYLIADLLSARLPFLPWRLEFGVAALPAILFLALLYGIPQSSRWLMTQGRTAEARASLELVGVEDSDAELKVIAESVHLDRSAPEERLWQRKYAMPIFLAITIGLFNQLSGINAILYYVNDIFATAGFSRASSDVQAVIIGAMNLVATLAAMTVIDKVGRKALLLVGAVGMAICLGGVAAIFWKREHQGWLLGLLVAYIACFAISQGAVIWVYLSEVFPTRVRAKGQSVGSFTHWATNAAIALTFPRLAGVGRGAAPFAFFMAMMVVQFFVVWAFYPETKRLTLEQLQQKLHIA
jgi:sugar porter (SP) family MFS transporter